MLLPDQTYDDYGQTRSRQRQIIHKTKPTADVHHRNNNNNNKNNNKTRSKSSSSSNRGRERQLHFRSRSTDTSLSTSSYERTAYFFNNIPDFLGDNFKTIHNDRQRSDGPSYGDERSATYTNSKESQEQKHNSPYFGNTTRVSTTNSSDVLRLCEDFLCRHRMRPDFFCQYQKAVSSAVSSPNQAQTPKYRQFSRPNQLDTNTKELISVKSPTPPPASSKIDEVERFTKFSAIYTLPVAKRKKTCIKSVGNITDASSSNEAVHLQQRLKSLSTELVTLRNRLHVGQTGNTGNGGSVATPHHQHQQQQHAQSQGPTSAGLDLHASTPNLTNNGSGGGGGGVGGGNGGGVTTLTSNSIQQHAGLMSSLNHHTHSHANTVTHSHNEHHTLNKNPHTFSQTLPHNSSGTGIISSRNTSIPHPLPHQINEKANGNSSVPKHNFSESTLPLHGNNTLSHSSHTLPMRTSSSSAATASNHHNNNQQSHQQQQQQQQQQFPFIPVSKHLNPCQGINTLPFGFANSPNSISNGGNRGQSLKMHNGIGSFGGGGFNNGYTKQSHDVADLIHLPGPLTEHAVMRTLHARFNENCYFTNVGPILLSINPYLDVGNPLTLSSTRSLPLAPQLHKIVQEAVRQQAETGYPQAIILSGTSGAGKTHCSMLLLRQLFAIAGGGPETDAFKHLAAAFTVLRSLGSAKTTTNSESSRIGQFIEVQVTDGALYRTKIHCYFLDQTRVIRPLPKEKNYHIFYQMLAGLSREERIKLNLEGYSPANLRYLQLGDIGQNEQDDALRFQAWKTCLGILGIPFLDVVRVLAAVLLLGNVQFIDGGGLEVDVKGETELNSVASLLGVPPAALFRGLTTRTHNARGQLVKSVCDANMSNMTRDCLAKALYCRTVATIVRRANSLKRLGSTLGTLSSDSNESVHNQADVASQHASTIGGNSGSKSMAALNNAVRHATDGFIGILDMFGFEEPSPHAQLEHLCINLCAETMQHFYNTHIFKSSVESCRDEGIVCDTEVDYVDNVPCIDLISSLRTGLLSMLDAECSVRGTAESYVAKIKVQHRNSSRLESKHAAESLDPRTFLIRHFAGRVEYDATDFLDTNRDVVPDDLVAVFYKHTCNFGFATHLFGSELKALYAMQNAPRGLSFRISPTSHSDLLNGDEPVSTLTQDFHTRLDNLLRTLVHARPHFVRCIRSNGSEMAGTFERATVVKQIRALQVLETVNLMASGFPHRMRFKQFNARYRMLAPFRLLRRTEDKALEDCNLILQYAMENPPPVDGSVTLAWASGKRHVFLSEGIRQHLEHLRTEIRNKSATLIQATWRGWQWRKKMGGGIKRQPRGILHVPAKSAKATMSTSVTTAINGIVNNGSGAGGGGGCGSGLVTSNAVPRLSAKNTNLGTVTRPRPQPIAGTPPPDPNEKCDQKIIQQTCSLFGLDLERPPPVPPSRAYTIMGNTKLGYPQSRIMKMNFPEDALTNPAATTTAATSQPTTTAALTTSSGELQLKKGEAVTVVAASTCRGHLVVEHKGQSFHVPFQYMELVRGSNSNSNNNNNNNNNNKANIVANNSNQQQGAIPAPTSTVTGSANNPPTANAVKI